VREYRQGDSLRHVHWPSTARYGSLVVREFEQERPARLVVVVDTWGDAALAGDESALDVCCSAAGSVALAAMAAGHRVQLAAARDGEIAPPADVDRRAALVALAELRAPGGMSLPVALETAAAGARGAAAWLVAFPTWRPNGGRALVDAVTSLGHGGRVAAAVVEAPRGNASRLTPDEVDRLEAELAAAGVDVYRIRPEEDLAACLQRSPSAIV
jgi:uncharacterized protein (DUF58 family)